MIINDELLHILPIPCNIFWSLLEFGTGTEFLCKREHSGADYNGSERHYSIFSRVNIVNGIDLEARRTFIFAEQFHC